MSQVVFQRGGDQHGLHNLRLVRKSRKKYQNKRKKSNEGLHVYLYIHNEIRSIKVP